MSLRLRSVWRGRVSLHDLGELRAKSANHGEFFTAKRAASGANVDELNDGSEVVNVDGGFWLFGVHVFWIRNFQEPRHVGEVLSIPQPE